MTARLQPLSRHTAAPDSGLVTQLQPVARQSIHTGACGINLTDRELEAHILDCGRLFLKAHADGDMVLARHWLAEQTAAVKSRSPTAVARLEECYFSAEGERALYASQARMVR